MKKTKLYDNYVSVNFIYVEEFGYYLPRYRTPICGAKTKSTGQPCKIKEVYRNGRCKLHGGASCGPKTLEGKKRAAKNGFKKGWRSQV